MPAFINPLMTSAYDVTLTGVSSMPAMMMMMMMYRTAAAAAAATAVRYVAPSPSVDWTHLLTATAPMTTAGGGASNTPSVPSVSCPALPLQTL